MELISRRGLRRIAGTGHSNIDLEHRDHNEKSLRVNLVLLEPVVRSRVSTCVARARVYSIVL